MLAQDGGWLLLPAPIARRTGVRRRRIDLKRVVVERLGIDLSSALGR